SRWYRKDAAFDQAFRDRFLATHEAAARGELDAWLATPEGALALCILLDQFPRNAFRGSPRMFASDAKAREVARGALGRQFDQQVDGELRQFFIHRYAALCGGAPGHHRAVPAVSASQCGPGARDVGRGAAVSR
ncbi:MAG: hypothetical protein K0S48_3615, partial [Ramlibacter sp.]|nr:hypothetical protein [Ramlibacter sp.]